MRNTVLENLPRPIAEGIKCNIKMLYICSWFTVLRKADIIRCGWMLATLLGTCSCALGCGIAGRGKALLPHGVGKSSQSIKLGLEMRWCGIDLNTRTHSEADEDCEPIGGRNV